MTVVANRLWGAVWTSLLALFISGLLRPLQWDTAFPWYEYLRLEDFLPFAVMLTLTLLASSKFKLAALALWVLVSLLATYAGLAQFPNWGEGITDVSAGQEARFEGISAVSGGLMYFAAAVLAASGIGLLCVELARHRQRTSSTPMSERGSFQ